MSNAGRIGLGTVQFGMAYGIANPHGQVALETAAEILRLARGAGVRLLDTAAAYGQAEEVLGRLVAPDDGFRIITKTAPGAGIQGVVDRARQSHRVLGGRRLHGLLVHSAADLRTTDGPALWGALQGLRDEGLFARIGISVYASDDPLELARRFRPDIMQLPVSVLDQRLVRSGVLRGLKDLGVEIHARSLFLQGAIFLDPAKLPLCLAHAAPRLAAFQARLAALGLSPVEAGIGYPLSVPEIDYALVGVTAVAESHQILYAAAQDRSGVPWHELAVDDEVLLDPRQWVSDEAFRARAAAKPVVLAVLQARMSSTRLPGKVLKPILGRPMLGRHIDRLKRSRMIDRLVVATSVDPSDDPIAAFCAAEGIGCHRGSLHDVLARYEGAARDNDPVDHIVRLTGDCPLADPEVIDRTIEMHVAGQYDYSSNTNPPTYPDGLDTEVMTREALRLMAVEAATAHQREHVTSFLYTQPERFRLGKLHNDTDQSLMRWTVDTPDDFHMVDAVYRELLPVNERFGSADILALLERRPDIAAINRPR
ncbi:MAG: aldo/keto reductase [Reyranella sp.]|uniref:aldo/keto reductase n=1 Tax=Reyranella sp. TaxID=1929291 RepID=UPI001AC79CBB|nr:aldo/keto reductase [Reyranella sp.]MBN9088902.1 aldo/keto reductase [Reyranella sp.]